MTKSVHPELPYVPVQLYWAEDFTGVRNFIDELTMLSCVVYAILGLVLLRNVSRRHTGSLPLANRQTLRLLSWLFALVPLLIIFVKLQFQEDLGNYLLATYIAATTYTTSFLVMRGSSFFSDESASPPIDLPKLAGEPGVYRPLWGHRTNPT